MSTTSLLAGVAGEYFVAAELSRRGFIASITLRNTRGIDIVVTNKYATKNVTIQRPKLGQRLTHDQAPRTRFLSYAIFSPARRA